MNIIDCGEQRSPAWYQVRLGKVTSSRVNDVTARIKTGWGASRANYRAELVRERLTGKPQDTYINAAMQDGIDREPMARAAYEDRIKTFVEQVGFVAHPSIVMAGCSPDGLIGDDGLVEIKCPQGAAHLETLETETVPSKYLGQMQFQMACSGRQWCDYVSFNPDWPEQMQLFVCRVQRDDQVIATLDKAVIAFLCEVDAAVEKLSARYLTERVAA